VQDRFPTLYWPAMENFGARAGSMGNEDA
jgi:hypothetical protein